jgi:excisionase family DNA binding protein
MAVAETVIDLREHAGAETGGLPNAVERPAVWLSGQQAAEHVGVSWPTLRQAILDHAIPHVRLGRRWKIEVTVLDAHLRRLASGGTGRA